MNIYRILFTILLVVLLLVAVWLLSGKTIIKLIQKFFTVRLFGRKIFQIARKYDYMVFHNFQFDVGERHAVIDHILFGDKFIYLIVDKYYNDGLSGNLNDNKWFYYSKRKMTYVLDKNPMRTNAVRTEKFSLITQIDREFLISVVAVNDDAILDDIQGDDNNHICHISDLESLIRKMESRDMDPLDEAQAQQVIQELYTINKKHKGHK
ncbi:MAG: NERD domain-containing protein [Bacilli bacterium]|nr:NERD domain-containing protein [Bacilli bacterium]